MSGSTPAAFYKANKINKNKEQTLFRELSNRGKKNLTAMGCFLQITVGNVANILNLERNK